jgi:hypothetical protein
MVQIQVPDDYRPEFSKTYAILNNHFTVEVQYRGVFLEDEISPYTQHVWWFRLLDYDGALLVAGPAREKTEGPELTKENIANRIASFYGHGDFDNLRAKANAEKKRAASDEALKPTLDEIVIQCWGYTMAVLFQPHHPVDSNYDVVHKEMKGAGWMVILKMNFNPNTLYVFSRSDENSRIYISEHVKAHQHSIPRF